MRQFLRRVERTHLHRPPLYDPNMTEPDDVLVIRSQGIYCPMGDFYVDPWQPVERAVITHAHSDHARPGCQRYLTVDDGLEVLRLRVGNQALIEAVRYGEPVTWRGVRVSLHPAGHVLGSAQVRIEHAGRIWVISGDYKLDADPTCEPFEPVRCDTFISECTFGLPIYRWPSPSRVWEELNAWWLSNQALGRCSVVFAYALGKAQRVLAEVDANLGPIVVHGAVARVIEAYRSVGRLLPQVRRADEGNPRDWRGRVLVIAPPSAAGSPWLRRFGPVATASASGWMQVRGRRRQRALDCGFVVSDHADWSGLLEAIHATGAARVLLTHGATAVLGRYLRERGIDAAELPTPYAGEAEDHDALESQVS